MCGSFIDTQASQTCMSTKLHHRSLAVEAQSRTCTPRQGGVASPQRSPLKSHVIPQLNVTDSVKHVLIDSPRPCLQTQTLTAEKADDQMQLTNMTSLITPEYPFYFRPKTDHEYITWTDCLLRRARQPSLRPQAHSHTQHANITYTNTSTTQGQCTIPHPHK